MDVLLEPDSAVWIEVPAVVSDGWVNATSVELVQSQPAAVISQAEISDLLEAVACLDRSNDPTWRLLFLPDITQVGVLVDVEVFAGVSTLEFGELAIEFQGLASEDSPSGRSVILLRRCSPRKFDKNGCAPIIGELRIVIVDPSVGLVVMMSASSPDLELLEQSVAVCEELAGLIRVI